MKNRKLIFVVVLAALASSTMFGLQANGSPWKVGAHIINHLSDAHPAPVSMLAALNDGRAFDPDYIHYPDSLTPELREQFHAEYTVALPRLKGMVAPDAKFYFLYATEFGVPPSRRVVTPMEYETAKSPSQFEFPAGASKQTYLVVGVQGKGEQTIHVHMLLWKVGGDWRPIVLSGYPATVRGLSAEHLLARIEVAVDAGDDLLALTHCRLAHTLARPTPYRVSGLQQEIAVAETAIVNRLGLGSGPLFFLTVDDSPIEIINVDGLNFPDGFFVQLHRYVSKLETNAAMEARQVKIAAAFRKLHPEFEKDFLGVAVSELSLHSADEGKGFRSLHPFAE